MIHKKIISIISTILLISQFTLTNVEASTFEEDVDEDMMIIEDEIFNDVEPTDLNLSTLRVSARNAIAIDSKTNQVLFEQNAREIVPMASTTKILTALVALNYGDLDREITISKNAASIRGSKVGYKADEKITAHELLFGLMFKSGNDAAIALAEDIGGSIEGFAKIMNDYAKSLGLVDSHFESPHGLDSSKHYTTAYDLAILTTSAMKNDKFREICGSKTMLKDKYNFTREYQNINKILYKIPEANGVKTGYTGQAGKCLVSSINHQDRNIIIVVLNCFDRWNVTEKIYKSVCESYEFKRGSMQDIKKSPQLIKLGSIIEDTEFDYGFKGEGSIEVEVFMPVLEKSKGDIVGKVSLVDKQNELVKKGLKCNKELSVEELENLIIVDEKSVS